MSALADVQHDLATLDRELQAAALPAELTHRLRDRVRAIQTLLDLQTEWIGTTDARRRLGLKTEHTVKAWAKAGLLRSRTTPTGRTLVALEDVLYRAHETDALATDWDEPLTDAESAILKHTRPGTTPWQRSRTRETT